MMPLSSIETTIGALGGVTPKSSHVIVVEPVMTPKPSSRTRASIVNVASLVVPATVRSPAASVSYTHLTLPTKA